MYVPTSDPERLESAFVERYPALLLTTTSNSGAFWGDGDARTDAIRHDTLQFAMEGKYRSANPKHNWPTPAEWRKAKDQLRVRSNEAVRLFAVYRKGGRKQQKRLQISIPVKDLVSSIYYLSEAIDIPIDFRMSDKTMLRHAAETLDLKLNYRTVAETPMAAFMTQSAFTSYYQHIEVYRDERDESYR